MNGPPLALVVMQVSADADPTAALEAARGAARYLLRPPELAALAVPDGAAPIAAEWRDRADAARIVRDASGARVVIVLDAIERADAELSGALAALPAGAPGVYRVRRRHRFLGREVSGARVPIAWSGVAPGAGRLIAGTLLRIEADVATSIARLDAEAARGAGAAPARVSLSEFVARPVETLLRRLWKRRRDGVPGVILSLLESYGEVLAAAKRWERRALLGQHLRRPSGMRLPSGFVALKTPLGWTIVRRDVDERLLGTLLEAAPDAVAGVPVATGGRGGAFLLSVGKGPRAVLRWYRRGGAFRRVLRDLYFGWRPRPILELSLTEEARRRGVATAEVLGARVDRVGFGFYRGVIVTRAIEDAATLAEVLLRPSVATERDAVLRAVAAAIRTMHERGVHHRDLNVANLLIVRDRGDVRAHLIDFDRAQVRREVPARVRRRALRRLDRSLAKLNRERDVVSKAERALVAAAYWDAATPGAGTVVA